MLLVTLKKPCDEIAFNILRPTISFLETFIPTSHPGMTTNSSWLFFIAKAGWQITAGQCHPDRAEFPFCLTWISLLSGSNTDQGRRIGKFLIRSFLGWSKIATTKPTNMPKVSEAIKEPQESPAWFLESFCNACCVPRHARKEASKHYWFLLFRQPQILKRKKNLQKLKNLRF